MRRTSLLAGIALGFAIAGSALAFNTDKLVLYLPFDEGKGNTTKDVGPLGLKGELIGNTEWVAGKFGSAVKFGGPGSGDYVQFDHDPALDAADAMTMMLWIRPGVWRNTCCDQVWGFGVHGGCGGRLQHGLFQEGGLLKARFEGEGGRLDVTADLPPADAWSHVAVTYDNGSVTIYINGEVAGEGKGASAVLKKGEEPFMVAGDCERIPQYNLDGAVDELVYFLRPLDADEIKEVMTRGVGVLAVDPAGKATTEWARLKMQ